MLFIGVNTRLDLISIAHSLNGSFAGTLSASDTGLLEPCGHATNADGTVVDPFRFGTHYRRECRLSTADFLTWSRGVERSAGTETLFHELYLRFTDDRGQQLIYPLPVINEDIRDESGNDANRAGTEGRRDVRWLLTRRFFLVDEQQGAGSEGVRLVGFKI